MQQVTEGQEQGHSHKHDSHLLCKHSGFSCVTFPLWILACERFSAAAAVGE